MKYGIAVAGSHGKTTTTSMVAQVLSQGGIDPTIVIGGKLGTIGSNAKLGKGPFLVAEADESDGSFLMLNPTLAVITNIDREHLDHYQDLDEIQDAFVAFATSVWYLSRMPAVPVAVSASIFSTPSSIKVRAQSMVSETDGLFLSSI